MSSRLHELLEDLCRHAGIEAMHDVVETHDVEVEGVCVHLDANPEETWMAVTALLEAPPRDFVDRVALMRAALDHAFEARTDPDAVRFSLAPSDEVFAATLLVPLAELSDAAAFLAVLASAVEIAQDEFSDLCLGAALGAREPAAHSPLLSTFA